MSVRLLKFLDATLGMFLCWAGGRILYLLHREAATRGFRAGEIKRVLVIRPGGLGDMILLQPMLRALHEHYPQAGIDLICEKRNEEILALSQVPVKVLTYDAHPFRLLRRLWAGGYDVVVDSEQFHYFSAVMAALSRAPIRIGYKINPGRNPIYTHLITYDMERYEADEFMKLLGPFGISSPAVVAGCLAPPEINLPDVFKPFSDAGQEGSRRLVLIHVGTSVRYKMWSLENFVRLVQGLGLHQGHIIGLVGGGADAGMAAQVAQQSGMKDRIIVMAGQLSLSQTAKVLARTGLFVGGDSGLAHLAAAFNVPAVVMFGPSDAQKWCRESASVAVVRKPMACSPCFIFGYHKYCRTIACMRQLGVEEVLEACRRVAPVLKES